jgi:(p)ppGpp synthase/HD superfamily hydrolase
MHQSQIAAKIALEAHKDQWYSSTQKYAYHLNQVADFVVKMYENKVTPEKLDNLVAIAYLHDVLEDTPTSQSELTAAGISDKVLHAVVAMTKAGETYEHYIAKVLANKLATRVKLCDTAANLSNSLQDGNKKRINKYTKQIQLLGGFK